MPALVSDALANPANDRGMRVAKSARWLMSFGNKSAESKKEAQQFNRLFLEVAYPQYIGPREQVLRAVVVNADQWTRLWTLLIALAVFFASAGPFVRKYIHEGYASR